MSYSGDINIGAFDSALSCLNSDRLNVLKRLDGNVKRHVREIRIYAGKAVVLSCDNGYMFAREDGSLSGIPSPNRLIISARQLKEIFAAMCEYSVYSVGHEVANGYITVRGGHRAGICGTAVPGKDGMTSVKDISSINLRIARQLFGSADKIVHILKGSLSGLIIAGPPCSGKTTVLRDLARQLSSGAMGGIIPVAVADERGEIGAVKNGVIQNDLGFACDCLDGYPKHIAIEHAVRCLSPQIALCDEITSEQQVDAVSQGFNSGVRFVVTVHAMSREDLRNRSVVKRLIATGAFEKIAMLGTDKQLGEVVDSYDADSFV